MHYGDLDSTTTNKWEFSVSDNDHEQGVLHRVPRWRPYSWRQQRPGSRSKRLQWHRTRTMTVIRDNVFMAMHGSSDAVTEPNFLSRTPVLTELDRPASRAPSLSRRDLRLPGGCVACSSCRQARSRLKGAGGDTRSRPARQRRLPRTQPNTSTGHTNLRSTTHPGRAGEMKKASWIWADIAKTPDLRWG
jgi:hypothetical protein